MHMKNLLQLITAVLNHTGSSGAMEAGGLVDCLKSSIQNHGLQ